MNDGSRSKSLLAVSILLLVQVMCEVKDAHGQGLQDGSLSSAMKRAERSGNPILVYVYDSI